MVLAPVSLGSGNTKNGGHRYALSIARDLAELTPHIPQWEQLAGAASEPNIFYEHWMLLPAIRLYAGSDGVQVVLIHEHAAEGSSRLVGVWPLRRRSCYGWLGLTRLQTWMHPHCYLGTPLLAAGAEEACWETMFGWLRGLSPGGGLLDLDTVRADGPIYTALLSVTARHKHHATMDAPLVRPLLKVHGDAEAYMRDRLGRTQRQTLRRKRRRLCDHGELTVHVLEPHDNLKAWLEEFFSLESSGWKGGDGTGTALACSSSDREFFSQISHAAFERNRLLLVSLRLNGRAIASLHTLLCVPGAFALKIGYDERWARYSPGRLLALDTITALHARGDCQWIDSCAAPGSWLAEQWKEERLVIDGVYGAGPLAAAMVSSMPLAKGVKRRMWRLAANWREKRSETAAVDDEEAGTEDDRLGARR